MDRQIRRLQRALFRGLRKYCNGRHGHQQDRGPARSGNAVCCLCYLALDERPKGMEPSLINLPSVFRDHNIHHAGPAFQARITLWHVVIFERRQQSLRHGICRVAPRINLQVRVGLLLPFQWCPAYVASFPSFRQPLLDVASSATDARHGRCSKYRVPLGIGRHGWGVAVRPASSQTGATYR